jgi:hypothetical protein
MPIDSVHPDYEENYAAWQKCRDVYDGAKAIKSRPAAYTSSLQAQSSDQPDRFPGSMYLPPLKGQNGFEYKSYKNRALFNNVTGRAAHGLVGVMTRVNATFVYPKDMAPLIKDATGTGVSFNELLRKSVLEILLMDRVALLPDMTASGRPFITPIPTENIINWYHDGDGNLQYAIIREIEWKHDLNDKYMLKSYVNYRELTLDENGRYIINLWTKGDTDKTYSIADTIQPKVRGKALDYIPLIMVNSLGMSWDIEKSVLLDLADVNLSHYRTSADLEHGRHFTALPTPVITGVNGDTKLTIGSTTAIAIPDHRAKAYYLEFNGSGLTSLETAIKEKEQQMASMSARLIDQNRKGSEAAETVRLRYSGEANMLAGIAGALEGAYNLIYKLIAVWIGESEDEVEVKLNKDFLDSSLPANALKVLMEMYLSGAMDIDTYIYNLKRGELIEPGLTDDEIRRRFMEAKPIISQPANKPNGDENNA